MDPSTVATQPPSNGTSNGVHTEPPQAPPDPIKLIERIEATVKDLAEKYDGRISDMGKQLARFKQQEKASQEPVTTNPQQAAPVQPGLTLADIRAAMALDRAKDGLPDGARRHLEQLEEGGVAPSVILDAAKLIRMGMGLGATPGEPQSATQSQPATRERPATAPPRTGAHHPKTLGEYYELARVNPELKKQLDKDPTFHPEDLPHR